MRVFFSVKRYVGLKTKILSYWVFVNTVQYILKHSKPFCVSLIPLPCMQVRQLMMFPKLRGDPTIDRIPTMREIFNL